MDVHSTVLVGVDGTDDGERAVWHGVATAQLYGVGLKLVHAAPVTGPTTPLSLSPDGLVDIGRGILEKAARQAEEAGLDAARTRTVLADGSRSAVLLDNAFDAVAIVLGTRTSKVQHLVSGSTSMHLAARAGIPVHCVPAVAARPPDQPPDQPGVVVAGLHGSEADTAVLEHAFQHAALRGAGLRLVHAWRPVIPYDSAVGSRATRRAWENTARQPIESRVAATAVAFPHVAWQLDLHYERVPVALLEGTRDAELLVLGRHAEHGWSGLALGSTTRTLIRTAPCCVVVVPPEGHRP